MDDYRQFADDDPQARTGWSGDGQEGLNPAGAQPLQSSPDSNPSPSSQHPQDAQTNQQLMQEPVESQPPLNETTVTPSYGQQYGDQPSNQSDGNMGQDAAPAFPSQDNQAGATTAQSYGVPSSGAQSAPAQSYAGQPYGSPYSAQPGGGQPYGTGAYPAQSSGAQAYDGQPYGSQPYGQSNQSWSGPAQPYASQQYPDQQYTAQQYAAQPYAAQQYSAQQQGAPYYGAQQYQQYQQYGTGYAPAYQVPANPGYAPPTYVQPVPPLSNPARHSRLAAGLLSIFLGVFGIGNFYLGHTGKGMAQLMITLIGFFFFFLGPVISCIWSLIEGILILVSSPGSTWHRDGYGQELTD